MARRTSKVELSLFPFLNILFGLIAVLIIHIFFIIQKNAVEGSAIGRARAGPERAGGEEQERLLSDQLQTMVNRLADLDRQRQRAEADLEQRQLLLELRKQQDLMPAAGRGTAGVPIGAPVPKQYRIIPITGGSADNTKRPILVEVCADCYIVYDFSEKTPKKTKLPVIPNRASTKPGEDAPPLEVKPQLKEFLDKVDRAKKDQYLLFLIRPEGIASWELIRDYCIQRYNTRLSPKAKQPRRPSSSQFFDFGYETFSDQWLLLGEAAIP